MDKVRLQEELKKSMLAKDTLRTSVLRLLLSSLNYYEIEKGGAGYSATPEDVLSVIQKEAKQRRDSIAEFEKAGRQELVDKEKKELEILQTFLPEQISEEEVVKIVEQTISETEASGMQDMGKVMGALNVKLKGKADMGM
ncbi:MAG: GatB/YqeY domain-containing protein, partial [Patescibacteria group bacterium]